jgi:hypothetical protein
MYNFVPAANEGNVIATLAVLGRISAQGEDYKMGDNLSAALLVGTAAGPAQAQLRMRLCPPY